MEFQVNLKETVGGISSKSEWRSCPIHAFVENPKFKIIIFESCYHGYLTHFWEYNDTDENWNIEDLKIRL